MTNSHEKHRNPNGTYDGVGIFSELTGTSRGEVLEVWEQVKANQAKLDACPWHEFEAVPGGRPMRQKYQCKHCGGVVDAIAYRWHEAGRQPRPGGE